MADSNPGHNAPKAQIKPNGYPDPGPDGNTQGMVVPKTAPAPAAAPPPPVAPQTPKEQSWWSRWGSPLTHGLLDAVGLIPGVGEIADGANALIYTAEGDKANAALSVAAMVPGVGMAATVGKWGKKGLDIAQNTKAAATAAEAAGKGARQAGEAAQGAAAKVGDDIPAGAPKPPGGGRSDGGYVEGASKSGKYSRNLAERRKALLRDAKDPNSGLTAEQREFILEHNGNRVPPGLEVSHEVPLYTARTPEGKSALDVAENMRTIPKTEHRIRHKVCGDQYHDYPM